MPLTHTTDINWVETDGCCNVCSTMCVPSTSHCPLGCQPVVLAGMGSPCDKNHTALTAVPPGTPTQELVKSNHHRGHTANPSSETPFSGGGGSPNPRFKLVQILSPRFGGTPCSVPWFQEMLQGGAQADPPLAMPQHPNFPHFAHFAQHLRVLPFGPSKKNTDVLPTSISQPPNAPNFPFTKNFEDQKLNHGR